MKKVKFLGMIISVMFLLIVGQPMEAKADEYIAYTWESNGITGSWYADVIANESKKMDSAPTELTSDAHLYIESAPDEECATFLKNLSGDIMSIHIDYEEDVSITIGQPGKTLNTSIYIYDGDVTLNGKADYVDVYGGNLCINGDVLYRLQLGNSEGKTTVSSGNVVINGNVGSVIWYKEREEITDDNNYFVGNVSITGTVENGRIEELYYDEAIEQNIFVPTYDIEKCSAGIFKIENGVLSKTVPISSKEVSFNYYHIYVCYGWPSSNANEWIKEYYHLETDEKVAEKECTQEDIPEGARVEISSTATPVTLNMNLNRLTVYDGVVTLNGNIVESDINPSDNDGLVFVMGPYERNCDVKVNGDVYEAGIIYEYNPTYNLCISGKVDKGWIWLNNEMSYFDNYENIQIIKDGTWNDRILIKESEDDNVVAYKIMDEKTIADVVDDDTIGEEIVDGNTTIIKSVETVIKQTAQDMVDSIVEADSFKDILQNIIKEWEETVGAVVETNAVCAVDINIDSFYIEKASGEIYTANPTYGTENISELPNGNTLEISVKVPNAYYNEGATYTIVRQHENADGSIDMEQLETIQNGDVLTFESDKFSTFVIVEIVEALLKDTGITITNADGTIVKKGGIDESSGKYSFSGLVAGVYKLNVTRANYVSRTYTVEVKTDSEKVELDVKLHKLGDITGDGVINARDKKTLFNHIAGTSKLTDYSFEVADVNDDGVINARDKKMVFNHIAGTNSLWK